MQNDELHSGLGEDFVLTDSELRQWARTIYEKILLQVKKTNSVKIEMMFENVFSLLKSYLSTSVETHHVVSLKAYKTVKEYHDKN